MRGFTLVGKTFLAFGQVGGEIVRRNGFTLLLLAIWLTSHWVLLSRRDLVFPLSLEHPLFAYLDIMIIGAFDFVKLILIGIMAKITLPLVLGSPENSLPSSPSIFRWIVISFVFELGLLAIAAAQLRLEFGGVEPLSPVAAIAVKLGAVYLQMTMLWVAVFFYTRATRHRFDLVVASTIIYLVPAGLITTLIFYSPVVAPFWFGLNQLEGSWNILVQTVSVVGETLASLAYAVFFAVAIIELANQKDADSGESAS